MVSTRVQVSIACLVLLSLVISIKAERFSVRKQLSRISFANIGNRNNADKEVSQVEYSLQQKTVEVCDKSKHGECVDHHGGHHKIGLVSLVINIVADLCPHGILPVAYGFAKGGPTGIVPAVLLVVLFASMSGYGMTTYASLAQEVGTDTISGIWEKLKSPRSKWIVDFSTMALCYGCCLLYATILGDLFSALSAAVGLNISRASTVLLASTGMLLPLCLVRDSSFVQISSLLGFFGILYNVYFFVHRLLDKTYTPGSYMLKYIDPDLRPHFVDPWINLFKVNGGTLVLANLLCVSFLAHFNAISYFQELRNASTKYVKGISLGFGFVGAILVTIMLAGYSLFGQSSLPLILNNFPASEDYLATLARVSIAAAIVFAYPIMFSGLKSSLFPLLEGENVKKQLNAYKKEVSTGARSDAFVGKPLSEYSKTAAILALQASITLIAMKCGEEDVATILGVVSSIFGCFLGYILPNYLNLVHQRQRQRAGLNTKASTIFANRAMFTSGIVFSILGVIVNLFYSGHHHSSSHS